jgi:hypothetical protein
MATNRKYVRRHHRGRLNHAEEMTLVYGPDPRWDAFRTEAECADAWIRNRDRILAGYHHARRPWAWWHYEAGDRYPGYDREQSTLFEANLLGPQERAELECWWHEQFLRAWNPQFFHCNGPGRILEGEPARKAHFKWADIPARLVKRWSAEYRRRERTIGWLAKAAVTEAAVVDEPTAG